MKFNDVADICLIVEEILGIEPIKVLHFLSKETDMCMSTFDFAYDIITDKSTSYKGTINSNILRRQKSPKGNWVNIDGNKEQNLNALDMAQKYGLSPHYFRLILRGEKETYKGWHLE
jgi:hypothetical protein